MQRRQFLGAAAALSGLPVSASTVVADGGDSESADDDNETDYGRSTVVTTAGGLEVFADGNHETNVTVSSHPEGIGLALSNGMGHMSVLLLPEDIESLCRELLDAKAKTQPDWRRSSRAATSMSWRRSITAWSSATMAIARSKPRIPGSPASGTTRSTASESFE